MRIFVLVILGAVLFYLGALYGDSNARDELRPVYDEFITSKAITLNTVASALIAEPEVKSMYQKILNGHMIGELQIVKSAQSESPYTLDAEQSVRAYIERNPSEDCSKAEQGEVYECETNGLNSRLQNVLEYLEVK